MESNKLIAEFMGYKFYNNLPQQRNGYQLPKDKGTAIYLAYSTSELRYHKDWNWLMPVVRKCKELESYEDSILYQNIEDALLSRIDRDDTYIAVVEFIKEYNRTNGKIEQMESKLLTKKRIQEKIQDLKCKHEAIRTILMESGSVEYGDCIIDKICDVVGIEPTTVYYVEGE